MAGVLVTYATSEGQTARVARHVADVLSAHGHAAKALPVGEVTQAAVSEGDALILGASLHEGSYQRAARDFVRRHQAALNARPSAFFSVSLAAASRDPAERADVDRRIADFCARAGWRPDRAASFAGALRYTRYGWFKRVLMRRIAASEGGATDTSRDHEYTDWDDVTGFAADFAAYLDTGGAASVR